MSVIPDQRRLVANVEENDATEGELDGWDALGLPFRIGWDGKQAVVRDLGSTPDFKGLFDSILSMADEYGTRDEIESKCGHSVEGVDLALMLEAVERSRPSLLTSWFRAYFPRKKRKQS